MDPAATRHATVFIPGMLAPLVSSWISDLPVPATAVDGGHLVTVVLAPGAIEILEITT